MKQIQLIKVTQDRLKEFSVLFGIFPYFHNYLQFALSNLSYDIWVDSYENLKFAIIFSSPAFFLLGNPEGEDVTEILKKIDTGNWIIPSSELWDAPLKFYFGSKLESHLRTKFDSKNLNLSHLESLKKPLPSGYELVRIGINQIQDIQGMLYNDLLKNYFSTVDFLGKGLGFCILEDNQVIGFAASNYPIINEVLEVYIRVDFNSDPRHRQKGFGTLLSVALIEYCLEHHLNPEWDSANSISAHLALKLGYEVEQTWTMYHIV
ncbi:MAG: GNAT family N-acetyltransferase [Firmicutes bacterium]|nr:GNAT family N-acetyltransferase [Bacillota bacterium]